MKVTLAHSPTRIMGEKPCKFQVSLGGRSGSKKARMLKSQMRTTLVTFFHIKGTVHFEFIPQVQSVNQTHCVEILKRLREAVRRKRPELWPDDWIFHHDMTPAHKALSVKQFLSQKPTTETGHPPYSPIWFRITWLFPKLRLPNGRRFQDTEDIQKM
jgi:hypothetical protein